MAADREGQESSNIRITSWYPGHMKKTRELIENNLKMVDLVIEVVDARIPVSSRNPSSDGMLKAANNRFKQERLVGSRRK